MKTKSTKKLTKKEVVSKFNSEKKSEYFLLDEDYGQDISFRVTASAGNHYGFYNSAGDYDED